MNGVGLEILACTPVPHLPPNNTPPRGSAMVPELKSAMKLALYGLLWSIGKPALYDLL